jgi:hypothetical protein
MISFGYNHFLNTFAGLLVNSGKILKIAFGKFSHNSHFKLREAA